MQVIIGYITKYVLEWVTSLALKWVKKESKINKEKKSIDEQIERVNNAIEKIEKGETVDVKELVDASRELSSNF